MIFIFNIREVVVSLVQQYYNIINFEKKIEGNSNITDCDVYVDCCVFISEAGFSPERFCLAHLFPALNENDLECEKGDVVTLLNSDDPDWWWVSHQDQSLQGFIPSSFARTYQGT